jgi:hypothetical protein
MKEWLPSTEFDYHWPPSGPFVGCNRLRCENCGRRVVTSDGANQYRHYACRCREEDVAFAAPMSQVLDPFTYETRPWRCEGHPSLQLPATIDGIALDDATNWSALVRELWTGARVIPAIPGAIGPTFWVERLFWVLPNGEKRDAVAHAIAALLDDKEVLLLASALTFFRRAPFAPGAERISTLVRTRPERLVGVVHPHDPVTTLWSYAADILSLRSMPGDDDAPRDVVARDTLRERAVAPPGVDSALFSMSRNDHGWLREHADAVVVAASNWDTALYVLRGLPAEKLGALAASIVARGQATRDAVLAELRLNHSEATVRAFDARV